MSNKPLVFNYKKYEELREAYQQLLQDNNQLMADNRKLRDRVRELEVIMRIKEADADVRTTADRG